MQCEANPHTNVSTIKLIPKSYNENVNGKLTEDRAFHISYAAMLHIE